MPSIPSQSPPFKEVTLPLLRSFCEAVRLGSFTAAAKSLGVSHPTVLSQVHALERLLGARLVETHARGCRATEDGTVLVEMAAPLVAGISSLARNFQVARADKEITLIVAATPRTLVEDLPSCVREFSGRWPKVNLRFLEMRIEEVPHAVEMGHADLGLTTSSSPEPGNAWVAFEPAYELEVTLITPKDHPLARRRQVKASDLRGYPLVNASPAFVDPTVSTQLEMLGAYQAGPRRVEAYYAAAVRRYVEMGFGIGVGMRVPTHESDSTLHERSLSHVFGCIKVYLVLRKGALQPPHARAFADLLRERLNRKPGKAKRK